MAFTRQPTKTPASIGNVVVILKDWPQRMSQPGRPAVAAGQSVHFSVDVVYSDGTQEEVMGDLAPHLSAAQITQLQQFMAAMRAKAVAELL